VAGSVINVVGNLVSFFQTTRIKTRFGDSFGLRCRKDLLVAANVWEKCAGSNFREKGIITSALKMETARFSETLACTNKSTQ
jgi:hypothetical protein